MDGYHAATGSFGLCRLITAVLHESLQLTRWTHPVPLASTVGVKKNSISSDTRLRRYFHQLTTVLDSP